MLVLLYVRVSGVVSVITPFQMSKVRFPLRYPRMLKPSMSLESGSSPTKHDVSDQTAKQHG